MERVGFDITISRKRCVHTGEHEQILPTATYAPWLSDRSFNEIYDAIKYFTLVDKYRCYELWQLVKESQKLEGSLLEIGVWRGGTGALIATRAKMLGFCETVYICDSFAGVVKAGTHDSVYRGGEHADASESGVQKLLKTLQLDNVKILSGVFPDETGVFIDESLFRFCHIDVDTYRSAKDIVEWIWPKLVLGGMIVFDDYGFWTCSGITKLVNEERRRERGLVVHNLNGHAILVKLA